MSNNNSEFSMVISRLTPDEYAWWKEVFESLGRLRQHTDEVAVHTGLDKDLWDLLGEDDLNWSIQHELDDAEQEVALYHDDGPNLDGLAGVIHLFVKKFRPTEVITFECAFTCDRPVTNQFGGALYWIDASGWGCTGTSALQEIIHERHSAGKALNINTLLR